MPAPSLVAQGPGLSPGLPALKFDQANVEYLVISSPDTFTTGFSWFAFIRPGKVDVVAAQATTNPPLTLFGDETGASKAQFGLDGGKLVLKLHNSAAPGSGWQTFDTNGWSEHPSLYDDDWHTVGVTVDDTTMEVTFYIDGVAHAAGVGAGVWENVTLVNIGGGYLGTDTFDGHQTEFETYDHAVTAEEALDLHNYYYGLWVESRPPELVSSTPAHGSANNEPDADITFTYQAPGIEIDETAEQVWLNGTLVYDDATGFQVGFAGTETTNADGSRTFTITTHPDIATLAGTVTVYAKDIAGRVGYFSFVFGVLHETVSNFVARTWCGGKRIDLTWDMPAGATAMYLVRSSQGYSRFMSDQHEVLYTGVPIEAFVDGKYTAEEVANGKNTEETSDEDLEENKFYYYSIFYTFNNTDLIHTLPAECQGLSIKDYYAAEGDYVYNLLPREVRRADAAETRGTKRYEMRDYCRVIQCGVNLYRGMIESTLHLRDPDAMPAGRIGDTENNYGILSAQLWDYGLPAGRSLDANTLRRLALSLVGLYRKKGTCPNLVDLTKVLCTWDARCDEQIEPVCGVAHLFHLWDAEAEIKQFKAAVDADFTLAAGSVTFSTARFFKADGATANGALDENPAPGFILDALGTFACVDSVAAPGGGNQVVSFEDAAATLRKEIVVTGTGSLNQFVITAVDTGSYPWQYPSPAAEPVWGPNAFLGLKIRDSADATFTITGSAATDETTGETVITVSGTPASGDASIAWDFDPADATYAGRLPLLHCKLYIGEFSLTYNPLWDYRLKAETKKGPWTLLTALSSTLGPGWAPTPSDVVVIAQNVHEDKGVATDVYGHYLKDSTKTWVANAWKGYYLLPDWNQPKIFRIAGNTPTEVSVELPVGAGDLDTLAQAGSNYVILTEQDAIRFTNLYSLLPSFLPMEIRPLIKFETV